MKKLFTKKVKEEIIKTLALILVVDGTVIGMLLHWLLVGY